MKATNSKGYLCRSDDGRGKPIFKAPNFLFVLLGTLRIWLPRPAPVNDDREKIMYKTNKWKISEYSKVSVGFSGAIKNYFHPFSSAWGMSVDFSPKKLLFSRSTRSRKINNERRVKKEHKKFPCFDNSPLTFFLLEVPLCFSTVRCLKNNIFLQLGCSLVVFLSHLVRRVLIFNTINSTL